MSLDFYYKSKARKKELKDKKENNNKVAGTMGMAMEDENPEDDGL